MGLLHIAGDALWIVALSIMASVSQAAWKRIEPETRVPVFGLPELRLKRGPALILVPAAAFVVGIVLVLANRQAAGAGGPGAVILFGVRATSAALFALLHLRWLKAALEVLAAEGSLKP